MRAMSTSAVVAGSRTSTATRSTRPMACACTARRTTQATRHIHRKSAGRSMGTSEYQATSGRRRARRLE
jgi:hypothetical protein